MGVVDAEKSAMNKVSPQDTGSPPPAEGVEPPRMDIGRGHPEFHFVQALMELNTAIHKMDTDQKVSMARMEEKMSSMKEAMDSTKSKVESLVRWRIYIVAGAIVLGACISLIWSVVYKFSDWITISKPGLTQQIASPVTPAKK